MYIFTVQIPFVIDDGLTKTTSYPPRKKKLNNYKIIGFASKPGSVLYMRGYDVISPGPSFPQFPSYVTIEKLKKVPAPSSARTVASLQFATVLHSLQFDCNVQVKFSVQLVSNSY